MGLSNFFKLTPTFHISSDKWLWSFLQEIYVVILSVILI